jgi:hypothetical protein
MMNPMSEAPSAKIRALHEERGWVVIEPYDEAILWMRRPVWMMSDDPEAGSFENDDFDGWLYLGETISPAKQSTVREPVDGPPHQN